MCGIVGFTGYSLDEPTLRKAVDSLHHRGPDGSGYYSNPNRSVGLGHARLAIIDLETGAQPIYARNRELVVVCNGEIYDFERTKDDLMSRGHKFYTKSDSEVILHLYMEYGMDFTEHLRGEFAFLLLDERNGRLLAVRDRFGIKPLFYHHEEGKFVFASEAKAIFATGCLQPKIDVVSVRNFLSGVIPDSIFEGIQVVSPGCMMEVDLSTGGSELYRYWDLNLPLDSEFDSDGDLDHHIRTVQKALEEAVRLRLRADVPVGVYLSGGIDSSVLAALMGKLHNGPLKAFTIAFPEDETFNEFRLAEQTAKRIGAEFHSVTCDRETMLANIEDSLWVSELPFFNFHGVGKFLLSRLASQHVKVVLTGEGSDELFLGYSAFQPLKSGMLRHLENRMKSGRIRKGPSVRNIERALGFLPLREYAGLLSPIGQKIVNRLFHADHRPEVSGRHPLDLLETRIMEPLGDAQSFARKVQFFWIKSILAPYILTILGDRQEMGHSLEGRTPFLDHHFFEKIARIPDGLKIREGIDKYVLREAFRGDVVKEVYNKGKWPYSAPPLRIENGSHLVLNSLIERHLSKEAIERSGIFDYKLISCCLKFAPFITFDCTLKRRLDQLLIFVLTIQLLDHLFVQEFNSNLNRSRCRSRNGSVPPNH